MEVLQLLASFFGPVTAATMVMIGWKRTHSDASSRDLENWRRTTLAEAVTDLISEGEDLLGSNFDIDNEDDRKKQRAAYRSMEQKKSLILMCDPGHIWEAANNYLVCVRQLMNIKSRRTDTPEFWQQVSDKHDLVSHAKSMLVGQLPISIKLRPKPPHDNSRAYVGHLEELSKKEIRYRKTLRIVKNSVKPKSSRTPWTSSDETRFVIHD